jgi:hypothetical protein
MSSRLRRGSLAVAATAVSLIAAELAIRWMDGWPVWGRLPLAEHAVDEATARTDRPDRRYVQQIRLADGVLPEWYEDNPPTAPRIPLTPDLAARARQYPDNAYDAFTAWNRAFLELQVCSGVTDYGLGVLEDEFVFTPTEPGLYPLYRNLPSVSPPGWFVTNRFGWRGPDLALNKDGRTIRIAFVGASTTVGAYYLPFSYPEFVGHWLDLWIRAHHPDDRVEVINAARTGIDVDSIAAIVRQEVAPLEPDLVVYYEGANSIALRDTLKIPQRWLRERPRLTFRPPSRPELFSALARRVTSLLVHFAAADGREPAKGTYPLIWPADLDERRPDPDFPALPMGLGQVIRDLDSMQASVRTAGGEFAVASFAWMVPDPHVPLDLKEHRDLYTYLNRTLWPISYQHLRRMTDFQNELFRAYADKRHSGYFEVAASIPRDVDLFGDPIHMGEPGLRLQAWIIFQQLAPWIERRLADHRLPRRMQTTRTRHPAFSGASHERVLVRAIKDSCRHIAK